MNVPLAERVSTPTNRHASEPAVRDNDHELVARLQEGDVDALGELYDRYASTALGVALRIVRERENAEDVVHDAYLSVWRRIGTYDPARGNIRSWLLVIVRNRAIDRVRASRPAMQIDEANDLSLLRTDGDSTVAGALARLTATELREAVHALPAEQRRAVELAYFHGLTYREIAEMDGIPQGTANGRLRLALRKLRDLLHEG